MAHKRSTAKIMERSVRQAEHKRLRALVLDTSFHDKVRAENVSLVSREDLLAMCPSGVSLSDVPDVVRGEVLSDSRGTGSFQR